MFDRLPPGLAALILSAGMISAFAWQAPQQPSVPPGVEINATARPETAAVGDLIRIEIDIAAPDGYSARAPSLSPQWGEFSILEEHPGSLAPITGPDSPGKPAQGGAGATDARSHFRAVLTVAVYRVGEFDFAPVSITLRDPAGLEFEALSPACKVIISSVLTGEEPVLRDLKKQAEIQEPVRWILWLALGAILALCGLLAWWFWNRRRPPLMPTGPVPALDPFAQLEAELRDLLGRSLLEKGFIKPFYVSLSEIVKKAIELGCGTPTVERTTQEIVEALRGGSEVLSGVDISRMEEFLRSSDLVKFAKYSPSPFENERAVKNATAILEECRHQRLPAPALQPQTLGQNP